VRPDVENLQLRLKSESAVPDMELELNEQRDSLIGVEGGVTGLVGRSSAHYTS
jgi:hypothetical protein